MKNINALTTVSLPLVLTGCFGALNGSSWLGSKTESCWGDTGGQVGCDEETLPYFASSNNYYEYRQLFMEFDDEQATVFGVYIQHYDDDGFYGYCYSSKFDLTSEGTTYTLKYFDGDLAFVCEKDKETLTCTEDEGSYATTLTFTKSKDAFDYEAILERIYSEQNATE